MSDILSPEQMIASLKKLSAAHGLTIRDKAPDGLTGDTEKILAKWWFGSRKVSYRMSCRLSQPDHTVHFREAVIEKSWGIPPPTLTVETTTTSGWTRLGERKDVSLGGQGGTLDFAVFRKAAEKEVVADGWTFHLEGGRMP